MYEIPPHLEQLLRTRGVDDAQLDELRRTGRLKGDDGAGNAFAVDIESTEHASMTLNGMTFEAAQVEISPEALQMLQRFHRFIPRSALESLEMTTGTDIDGDGHVGRPAGSHHSDAGSGSVVDAAKEAYLTRARTDRATTGDPFVTASAGRSLGMWLLAALLIAAAVAIYLLLR